MEFSPDVIQAFSNFRSDPTALALPVEISHSTLRPLISVSFPKESQSTFQQALNRLDGVLSPKHALYLILRRNDSNVAITYVPYLASAESRNILLQHRAELIRTLGGEHFAASIICKEMGEITDARSWEERDGQGESWEVASNENVQSCEKHEGDEAETEVKDLGYKKNKCRLCDRRMKNKINEDALSALSKLHEAGTCVQLSVNIPTEILRLNFHVPNLAPASVSSLLPTAHPSFTFYRHLTTNTLYFIFCSPDSASVQERMKHTMAIPGLVNIIAKNNGVNVDQKIEIHDVEDLVFEERDERIGQFRSMYLRGGMRGTESTWEGMEEYQRTLDKVR
ncbi:hypothetical protein K458DRAFT_377137 [Lentithecium fluviatile CBS 122367]|uniref:ADF-H domain-containing protein n=1 Tax=Lentithecium fluviatile CBS 122367 TaxID=1168545 RepID=A0A6G1IJ62_9PLEO|nr:hypothetical protein K458DRAFT_377137 [Lentithecium fluviatile CBS 122367]